MREQLEAPGEDGRVRLALLAELRRGDALTDSERIG
jgi:hypothetical protein